MHILVLGEVNTSIVFGFLITNMHKTFYHESDVYYLTVQVLKNRHIQYPQI